MNNYIIPEWGIVLLAFLAVMGCVRYAYTRVRIKMHAAWAWLAVPCLQSMGTYSFFLSQNIALGDRVGLARLNFASFLITIIVITFTLSHYNVKYR